MNELNALNRRQFLKMAGLTLGTMALASCAVPAAPAGSEAEAPAAAGATLRYRTWHAPAQSEGDAAWYEWLSENYTAATIEYETVPFGAEYIQKVLADSAAGTPPDLLHSSIIWAREFYDRDVLLDLDDYIADVPDLAPDQFYGEATNSYRSKDGKYYGVPWEGPDAEILAVNSTLLEEAGYDPQGADIKTWDDLVDIAQALTIRDGDTVTRAGYLAPNLREIQYFNSLLVSNGGAMHNEEITEPTFNNEQGLQVLQMQLAMQNEHNVSFPISPERQDEQLFMQGQAAIIHAGTWSTAQFQDQKAEEFQYWFVIIPQGPQGNGRAGTTWSNMFVLPKGTPNPDAAWDLLQYCTTPPVVVTRFEISTRTTPHKAIFESEKWAEVLQTAPQKEIMIAAAEAGGVYPFFPFFTEANDAIGIELEQVVTGSKDPQEALNEAERKVAEVIARRTSA